MHDFAYKGGLKLELKIDTIQIELGRLKGKSRLMQDTLIQRDSDLKFLQS